jgi:hypothetical protein
LIVVVYVDKLLITGNNNENIVSLEYCRTDDKFVDIFPKPLVEAIFTSFT